MFTIEIDYPPTSQIQPRSTLGNTNNYIDSVLSASIDSYHDTLTQFQKHFPQLREIDAYPNVQPIAPHFSNDFILRLDCVSLYCMIAEKKPNRYTAKFLYIYEA
ncbi:hypothetical protein [aff. Roholtiella sp. LEGE 12411]|uniref:hypothetical protein n=1 Tax=aff. Roholtiella sp. LEGE 12411 TaxID=1828822 RepID=UPI00187EF923|nr:hypothetical protein [aff. Roholtiella sp. LEGE 12411]MBE9035244.1 hypothetical protein [aff. Roholtiella sp. LEGE 12411]